MVTVSGGKRFLPTVHVNLLLLMKHHLCLFTLFDFVLLKSNAFIEKQNIASQKKMLTMFSNEGDNEDFSEICLQGGGGGGGGGNRSFRSISGIHVCCLSP